MVGDVRVEASTERVPLQLKIAGELFRSDEKLHHLFLPEFTVAVGEGGLDIDVFACPAEIQGLIVVPQFYLGMFALGSGTVVAEKGFKSGGFGPNFLVEFAVDVDWSAELGDDDPLGR